MFVRVIRWQHQPRFNRNKDGTGQKLSEKLESSTSVTLQRVTRLLVFSKKVDYRDWITSVKCLVFHLNGECFSDFLFWRSYHHRSVVNYGWDGGRDTQRSSDTFHSLVPKRSGRTRNDPAYAPVIMEGGGYGGFNSAWSFLKSDGSHNDGYTTHLKTLKYCMPSDSSF